MCRLEPTKERIARTTIGITAIEIPHSTRSTLQQARCCQFYMWHNHLATFLSIS